VRVNGIAVAVCRVIVVVVTAVAVVAVVAVLAALAALAVLAEVIVRGRLEAAHGERRPDQPASRSRIAAITAR
jgi:hypothetical protein